MNYCCLNKNHLFCCQYFPVLDIMVIVKIIMERYCISHQRLITCLSLAARKQATSKDHWLWTSCSLFGLLVYPRVNEVTCLLLFLSLRKTLLTWFSHVSSWVYLHVSSKETIYLHLPCKERFGSKVVYKVLKQRTFLSVIHLVWKLTVK